MHIFRGIIFDELCDHFWVPVALTGSLFVSYVWAKAEVTRVKMEIVGIAERAELLVIFAVASFISIAWPEALGWSVVILAILTNLTVLQRVTYFHKASQRKEE